MNDPDKLNLLTRFSSRQLDSYTTLAGVVASGFMAMYSFGILELKEAGPIIAICMALDSWLTNKRAASK